MYSLTTIDLIGKAHKIVDLDRAEGSLIITIKAPSITLAIQTYNKLVNDIKRSIILEDKDDPNYYISVGELNLISNTDSVKGLFSRISEESVFERGVILFDSNVEKDITPKLLEICDKQSRECRDNSKDKINISFSITKDLYLSEAKNENTRLALLGEAIQDGYRKVAAILDGVYSCSSMTSHGVNMVKTYTGVNLVSAVPSDTKVNNISCSRSYGFLDEEADFGCAEESDTGYRAEKLSSAKTRIDMEIILKFEIEYK